LRRDLQHSSGVGHIEVAGLINGDANRLKQRRRGQDGRLCPIGGDLPDATLAGIGDEEIAGGIEGDALRIA
jgi:hypothetical protein